MLKKSLFILTLLGVVIILFALYSWYIVESYAKDRTFSDPEGLPNVHAALLLGTSPTLADGRRNIFYVGRMSAATKLLNSGKVNKVVVSGDNRAVEYNEPEYMTDDLIQRGFSNDMIHQDYAGFDTLDSVVRMHTIFSQEQFIVISQDFHVKRAIFLGRKNGLNVYGYEAGSVDFRIAPRVYIREVGARMKAVINVWTGAEPKFGGEKIDI